MEKNRSDIEESRLNDTSKCNSIEGSSMYKNSSNSSSKDTINNSASNFRVAQACDRCRSKKTRCDGRRPQCSQCAAVGFECKISDKLIRKAFPRGYTESLEERVRELEAENRKLLALCDLKEQQINIVTKYSTPTPDSNNNNNNNRNKSALYSAISASTNIHETTALNNPLNVSQTNLLLLTEQTHGHIHKPSTNSLQSMDSSSPYSIKSVTDTDPTSNNISPVNPIDAIDIKVHTVNAHNSNQSHVCDGDCCNNRRNSTDNKNNGFGKPNLHAKPVATNLNDPTTISFEQDEAPGLSAAKALKSIKNHENSTQLATLVSLSIPRSTEEILFIPQLMAKIRQTFGFTSKQCLYTVTLLSSLKSELPAPTLNYTTSNKKFNTSNIEMEEDLNNIKYMKDSNLWEINDLKHFFIDILKLSINKGESKPGLKDSDKYCLDFTEIDELIDLYFKHWSNLIPVLNRDEFFIYYNEFKHGIDNLNKENASRDKILSFNYKFFGCLLVTICQMGILIKIKNQNNKSTTLHNLSAYYHKLIYNIPRNPYFTFSTTSIKSLQLLSLILYYHLNTGDILEIYTLRGKITSMSQQLRLHRCPSAVLTGSGSTMNKFEQSNRRLLFWTIYYLDVFASLQLGVPRLIKDHEIECALPVDTVSSPTTNVADNIKNTINRVSSPNAIKLEGTVSQFSLAIIRFAKVLGNILDIIFKRNMSESISKQIALIHENALDNWRYRLPAQYQFKLGVTGSIDLKQVSQDKENVILILLYFLAKSMIHLPVFATKPITIEPVKDPNSEKLDRASSAFVSLQQAINTMLNAFNTIRDDYSCLPVDTSRTLTRFSLMSVQGSLDYIKGGSLYIDNKTLLLDIIQSIENDRKLDLPGVVSWHSLKLLDLTVNLYLQGTNVKSEKIEKFLQKKLNYYNKLTGKPIIKNLQSQKQTQKRGIKLEEGLDDVQIKKQSSISGENDDLRLQPAKKKAKLEQQYVSPLEMKIKNNKKITTASTQTEFAEAMQLDPILNSNMYQLSNFDLGNFFIGGNETEAPVNEVEKNTNKLGVNNNNKNGLTNSLNNSLTAIDKFFRIPSNGDFLSNLPHVPNANNETSTTNNVPAAIGGSHNNSYKSLNQNNNNLSTMMMFLNNEFSFSSGNINNIFNNNNANNSINDDTNGNSFVTNTDNNTNNNSNNHISNNNNNNNTLGDNQNYDGAMQQPSNNYNSNYDFIVDASLGLAPLLVDENAISRENSINQNAKQEENINLLSNGLQKGEFASNGTRCFNVDETDINRIGNISNNINNESELVLDVPRRYTYTGTGVLNDNKIRRPTMRRKRDTEAANDLYNWQNSK